MNRPPAGSKRVTDWVGRKVETLVVLRNGWGEFPVGTQCIVTHARSGLTLTADACKCCGVRVYIRRVPSDDVREVKQ